MIDICSWDAPGADRYVGSIPAAITAYGLPPHTQRALIDAWERRDFTDHILIDRADIRGRNHDYASRIQAMHFGARGRICATVTRAGWSDTHVESAVVICAEGECIAVPAVCSNVFRVTRIPRAPARPADDRVGDVVVAALAAPLSATIADPQTLEAVTFGTDLAATTSVGSASYGPFPAFGGAYAPAVPEPGTWALLLAGGVFAWLARRRAP